MWIDGREQLRPKERELGGQLQRPRARGGRRRGARHRQMVVEKKKDKEDRGDCGGSV